MSIFMNERYSNSKHLYASHEAAGKGAIVGDGNFVFDTGSKFAATVTPAAGSVSVADGVFSFCGRLGGIVTAESASYTPPSSDTLYIKCVVCLRYTKNASTSVETPSIVVIESEPQTSQAAAEALTVETNSDEITSASTVADFPLWEFVATASSATAPTAKFTIIQNLNQLQGALLTETATREAETEDLNRVELLSSQYSTGYTLNDVDSSYASFTCFFRIARNAAVYETDKHVLNFPNIDGAYVLHIPFEKGTGDVGFVVCRCTLSTVGTKKKIVVFCGQTPNGTNYGLTKATADGLYGIGSKAVE